MSEQISRAQVYMVSWDILASSRMDWGKGHDKNIIYSWTMQCVCLYNVPFLQVRKSDVGGFLHGSGLSSSALTSVSVLCFLCWKFHLATEPTLPMWHTAQKGLFGAQKQHPANTHEVWENQRLSSLPPRGMEWMDHVQLLPLAVSCRHALLQLTSPLPYGCFLGWQPN